MRLKRLVYGLSTICRIRELGYFIPYRYAAGADREALDYPWIKQLFSVNKKRSFIETLEKLTPYTEDLKKIKRHSSDPDEPRWGQDWFPGLDAAVAYGLVRARKPKQIIELGSGHSTRFLLRAIADGGLDTAVTCVDPAPRAVLPEQELELIKQPVQTVPLEKLPKLMAGDILLIDSSHIAMPGSDVDWVINNILPSLPKGALVHFHDIFLPDPYPAEWRWREYNEQISISALMAGGRVTPFFSSHFVRKYLSESVVKLGFDWIPLELNSFETSLWTEIAGNEFYKN